MIWALVGLAIVEAGLVHLLVALLWSKRAALLLSVISMAGAAWLVALVRSFRALPVTVDADEVVMRAGRLKAIRFARGDVAGVGGEVTAAELKDRRLLKLSLLAHPNVLVRLKAPVALGRRCINRVAHRLDDPAGFAAALAR